MNKNVIITLIVSAMLSCTSSSFAQSRSLFNGRDLNGWHVDVPEMDTNTAAINPFIIRNGLLVSLGTPQGHLITDSVYQNYRLNVEYRFAGKPETAVCLYLPLRHGLFIKCFPGLLKFN